LLTLWSYLRTLIIANTDPAFVPYTERRETAEKERKAVKRNRKAKGGDIESQESWLPADADPDSPGLEAFYSKDVFICESDGRPRWCALCWNWKPDRASHSSELERCVRKMDHLCPWVGGMISETNFNFFTHFTFYCTLFLSVCLGAAAYCLRLQQNEGRSLDGRIVAVLVLAGLFGFFAFGMTATSARYIFQNITNIDVLRQDQQQHLAIRVPLDSPSTPTYWTVTYPLATSPRAPLDRNGEPPPPADGSANVPSDTKSTPPSAAKRDAAARRTFALVKTELGENPFDLGPWRNFKSVMGNGPLEWLLPIWHSPCCNHDSIHSEYEFGPLINELRKRYKLPLPDENTEANGGS